MNALGLATSGLLTRKGTATVARDVKNAFKELIDRLETSANETGTGDYGLLEGVTLVEGPVSETFADENLPLVIYEILDGGIIEDAAFPNCVRASLTVLLTVMTHVDNGYFNDAKTGIIDLYEKLMTVIDGSTYIKLTGGGNWGPKPPQYKVGGFERDGLRYCYLVEVSLQSARYQKGTLQ
jgi:hypothetical protein